MDKNSVKTHFNDTHDVVIVRSPEMVKKLLQKRVFSQILPGHHPFSTNKCFFPKN